MLLRGECRNGHGRLVASQSIPHSSAAPDRSAHDSGVRWLADEGITEPVRIRDRVTAVIPAEAVRLEVGWFRRGTRRVNRWIGRIVLVQADEPDPLITVKVYGETWTLRSKGNVVGAARLPRAWETVNIVIDPEQIRLCFSSPDVMGLRSGRAVRRVGVGGSLSV